MTDSKKVSSPDRVELTDYKESKYKSPKLNSLKPGDKYVILKGKRNPVEMVFLENNSAVVNSLIENNKIRVKK